MTELSNPPHVPRIESLPLGRQSLLWRYVGDNRMTLIGPRAGVLQNMLPELGQAVLDHSVFFSDTLGRLKRSFPPIYKTLYSSEMDHTGHQVRDFHREIKGTMPDGGRYISYAP